MEENSLLNTDLNITLEKIKRLLGNPIDLNYHFFQANGRKYLVLYYNGMIDENQLFNIISHSNFSINDSSKFKWVNKAEKDLNKVLTCLSKGYAIIISSSEIYGMEIFTLNLPGWQLRAIDEPPTEQQVRGPREGFTETISVNTTMIRRWITDNNLRVKELRVGERTKTAVRVIYLEDVAHSEVVHTVLERIAGIKIDGVLESGYVEQFITDNRLTIFPLTQSTERTDKATAAILEGRVVILVDKSPFAIIVPVTINEFYQTSEDYYFNFYHGSFLRFFRLLGNNLAVALPGLYVALTSSNPELLPVNFALSIAKSRMGIPYPIYLEVILLEIFVEIFREAGLRLPKNVNQTLGIVAGIALAFSAVQARLVSGASLVVVAVGAISLFTTPSYSIGIPWRIFKFLLIFGASALGIVGLTLTGIFILANAAAQTSFGVSYMAPWAPLRFSELRDTIFRLPLWLRFFRPSSFRPKDNIRLKNDKDKERE